MLTFARKATLNSRVVEVTAEADKSPDSPIISGVTMKVNASSDARKELLEAAWRRTEANCPVLFIFKEPTQVKVEFEGKTEVDPLRGPRANEDCTDNLLV